MQQGSWTPKPCNSNPSVACFPLFASLLLLLLVLYTVTTNCPPGPPCSCTGKGECLPHWSESALPQSQRGYCHVHYQLECQHEPNILCRFKTCKRYQGGGKSDQLLTGLSQAANRGVLPDLMRYSQLKFSRVPTSFPYHLRSESKPSSCGWTRPCLKYPASFNVVIWPSRESDSSCFTLSLDHVLDAVEKGFLISINNCGGWKKSLIKKVKFYVYSYNSSGSATW